MRLWMDEQNRMLTDEQLLRQIAHHGSLSSALERGDVRLVASDGDRTRHGHQSDHVARPRLADYLQEG